MHDTLAQLDKEIARLKGILARGPVKGKLFTPHNCQTRIESLTRYRLKWTWPRVYRVRLAISHWLHRMGDWVWP
jgi:hypothetical protein